MKPRVECEVKEIVQVIPGSWVARLSRMGHHPRLGAPRACSYIQTSILLRIDFEKRELETLNTVYYYA